MEPTATNAAATTDEAAAAQEPPPDAAGSIHHQPPAAAATAGAAKPLLLPRDPTYDDFLEAAGHRGRYQAAFMVVIALAVAFPSMQIQSFNFTMLRRQFKCDLAGLNLTATAAAGDFGSNASSRQTDACRVQLVAASPDDDGGSGNASAAAAATASFVDCKRHVFSDSDPMAETVAETFGLTCGWEPVTTVVKVTFMLGFLVGSTCYGVLSDRWGRRNTFMLACVGLALSGVVAAFAKEVVAYAALRCLTGFAASGMLTVCFTWHTEMLHSSDRFLFTMLMKHGWSAGAFLLTGAAYWTRDWRHLELLISAPALLLVLCHLFVAESPRWLLQLGRTGDAADALRRIASLNGRQGQLEDLLAVTERRRQLRLQLKQHQQQHQQQHQPSPTPTPLTDLLRRPATRSVSLAVWCCFAIVSFGYYGLSLSWSDFGVGGGGSRGVFVAMALAGCAEVLARLLGTACGLRLGRVALLGVSLGVGGAALLLTAALQYTGGGRGPPVAATAALALAGRFGLLLAFELIWLYASEVFPTPVRNSAIGVGSTFARVGGVLAPQVGLLGRLWPPLPLATCGLVSLAGCALTAVLLPETRGRPAPDSLSEAERLIGSGWRRRCFLSECRQRRRGGSRRGSKDTEGVAEADELAGRHRST